MASTSQTRRRTVGPAPTRSTPNLRLNKPTETASTDRLPRKKCHKVAPSKSENVHSLIHSQPPKEPIKSRRPPPPYPARPDLDPDVSASFPAMSDFEMLHFVADLIAENSNYKSQLEHLRSSIATERGILSKICEMDSSIPVGSLMRLVILSQDRLERRARLEATERAWNAAWERIRGIDFREDMLATSLPRSSPASRPELINLLDKPDQAMNHWAQERRRSALQRERRRAEVEIELREGQMDEIEEFLARLDSEESSYWNALERVVRTSKTQSESSKRESSQLASNLRSFPAPDSISKVVGEPEELSAESSHQTGEAQEDETLLVDADNIPEIPDSPSSSIFSPAVPRIQIPLDSRPHSGHASATSEQTPWRLSANSSDRYSRSSGADSTFLSPTTPLNVTYDLPLPTIVSPDSVLDQSDKYSIQSSPRIPEEKHESARLAPFLSPEESFRPSFTFPSFHIPPLATPFYQHDQHDSAPDVLGVPVMGAADSAYSIVSHPAVPVPEALGADAEGAERSGDANKTFPTGSSASGNRRFKKLSKMFSPSTISTGLTVPDSNEAGDDASASGGVVGPSSILRSLLVPRRRAKSNSGHHPASSRGH